jgi:hypothetical protein
MIRLNLLPVHHRRRRTPAKWMAFMCVVVALNSTLFAWWTFSEFGIRLAVEAELDVLRLELKGIEPQLDHHEALQRERARHARREETLRGIAAESISWTAKLDQLTDVVTLGDEDGRHMVWFNDLTADINSGRRGEEGGDLRAGGVSGSERFAEVADFLDDLVASPFGSDLGLPAPPEGSASLVDSELQPSLVWSFPLQLALRAEEDRL